MLLTKTIAKTLPALYETDGVPFAQKRAMLKMFDPTGRGTWFAWEANAILADGSEVPLKTASADYVDVRFFGFVISPLGEDCDEMGYFDLSELQRVRGRFGLRIERDTFFRPETMANLETENGIKRALYRNGPVDTAVAAFNGEVVR
jgi:Protein of unknown function (DUF2958)